MVKIIFLRKERPDKETFRLKIPESCWMVISVDASPWGLRGILHQNERIVGWFADIIQDNDLRVLHAEKANPAFQTTWEALAILVAVRLWLKSNHDGIRVRVRSDSLSALSAAGRCVLRVKISTNHMVQTRLERSRLSRGIVLSNTHPRKSQQVARHTL